MVLPPATLAGIFALVLLTLFIGADRFGDAGRDGDNVSRSSESANTGTSASVSDFSARFAAIGRPTFPKSLCFGTQKPLFTREQRISYANSSYAEVKGWMNPAVAHLAAWLSNVQAENGVCGGVGEIGVHHGKFSIAVAHTLREGERSVAVDIFERQELNIDGSGNGNRPIFEENLKKFGIEPGKHVKIIASSSTEISAKQLKGAVGSGIRMFSVDAGHTAELTENDMRLAAAACDEGCVVFVDDIFVDYWAGVTEAVYSYLRSPEPHLLPFLMYTNKLLFTTPSHHQFYMDLIKSHPYFGKTTSFAPQRTKMLGTGFRLGPSGQGRDMDKERKAWVDYLKSLKE